MGKIGLRYLVITPRPYTTVDKQCSPDTSILAKILGHHVFHTGLFLLELVIHAF